MPKLIVDISQSLLDALARESILTKETMEHIVSRALADALQLDHGTLFQVSTVSALVEGISGDVVSIQTLKKHGDFGVGTFSGFDGEMAVLDGHFFRITEDGRIVEANNGDMTPFAVVTHFVADKSVVLSAFGSMEELLRLLDHERDSDNRFFAVRIDGEFSHIMARTVSRQPIGQSLSTAADRQSIFNYGTVSGTLMGFWTPAYARQINISGWHIHFLSDDRTKGGHLLDCAAAATHCQIQVLSDFRIAIPETAEFLRASLTGDPSAAIDKAEHKPADR